MYCHIPCQNFLVIIMQILCNLHFVGPYVIGLRVHEQYIIEVVQDGVRV